MALQVKARGFDEIWEQSLPRELADELEVSGGDMESTRLLTLGLILVIKDFEAP